MRFLPIVFPLLVAITTLTTQAHALEKSLDGGAHIWVGEHWGEFRAHVGPRYAWDWFSIRPNGAIGMAFLTGVDHSVTSFGGYVDFDAMAPLEDFKALQFGVGGGVGHFLGMHKMTGPVVPQGYAQAGYRWDGNYVGIMGLLGMRYDKPAEGYPAGMPDTLGFSGVGFRFEYEIDRGN
jgi:hypothetical protein